MKLVSGISAETDLWNATAVLRYWLIGSDRFVIIILVISIASRRGGRINLAETLFKILNFQ